MRGVKHSHATITILLVAVIAPGRRWDHDFLLDNGTCSTLNNVGGSTRVHVGELVLHTLVVDGTIDDSATCARRSAGVP